jgi:hypothetical protein
VFLNCTKQSRVAPRLDAEQLGEAARAVRRLRACNPGHRVVWAERRRGVRGGAATLCPGRHPPFSMVKRGRVNFCNSKLWTKQAVARGASNRCFRLLSAPRAHTNRHRKPTSYGKREGHLTNMGGPGPSRSWAMGGPAASSSCRRHGSSPGPSG